MSLRNMDNQQLFLWAAVAFAVYWIFFKNKQESYADVPHASHAPHLHHHHGEQHILNVTPPPPEEIPQYAPAFTG